MKNRKYMVITLTPVFKAKSLIEGENSFERANLLVDKNKATLAKYEIPGSVFIRRIRRR